MATWFQRTTFAGLLAVSLCVFCYRLGGVPLLDDPNEGEYAEVAREMVESGDWLTPRLNYTVFLNKPPLESWLIAAADLVVGVNELAARLPSALAAVAIVLLVAWLGTLVFDAETGLLAGFILVGMGGFFVETHEVRPDLILTLGMVGTLVAFVALLRVSPGARDWQRCVRWPLLAWQLALVVGVLAKGIVALVLPGIACAVLLLSQRRLDMVVRLLHPRAWWLVLLLAAPWHVIMSMQYPGFAWDYIVNQHVLFFFDQKFPHDSVPASLLTFWAALALRLFPWTIFVPLGTLAAWHRLRRQREAAGDWLVLGWLAAVLLFFSAASSRMEHYSIPALPAFALLLARLFREPAGDRRVASGRGLSAHVVAFALLALAGPFVVPQLVAAQEWLTPIGDFGTLARTTFTILAAGLLLAAAAALLGRRAVVAPLIVATFVAAVPTFHNGLTLLARINSSAPIAKPIRAFVEPEERLVFEAPVEYQSCAGLNFYLRRRLDLLKPAAFVPPAYLEPYVDELFISRDRLDELWQSERVYLITDPLIPRHSLGNTVPEPQYIVVRDNLRWVVTNRPFH